MNPATIKKATRKAAVNIYKHGSKISPDESEKVIREAIEPTLAEYREAIEAWMSAAKEADATLHQIAAISDDNARCVAAAYNRAYLALAAEKYSPYDQQ